MARNLTKKRADFVSEYAKTGNGTKAARKVFKYKNDNVAAATASRMLKSVKVENALDKLLSDENLSKYHQELFDHKRVDYFVFPKSLSDEEIVEHVKSVGITVITVRESDKGKMAFYATKDSNAVRGALDMGYKIKGRYAPEKSLTVTVDATADPVVAKQFNDFLKTNIQGGGHKDA